MPVLQFEETELIVYTVFAEIVVLYRIVTPPPPPEIVTPFKSHFSKGEVQEKLPFEIVAP